MEKCVADIESSKLKLKLKQWELEFVEETGRKPSKNDVWNASTEIRDAYKSYWKTKVAVQNQKTPFSEVDKASKTKIGFAKIESTPPIKAGSTWDSSLNKTSDCGGLSKSKKISSNVLVKYSEKLKANATSIRNKRVEYASMKPNWEFSSQRVDQRDALEPPTFTSVCHASDEDTKEKSSSTQRLFGGVKVKITTLENNRLSKSSKSISIAPGAFLNKDNRKYSSFNCDSFEQSNCEDLQCVVTSDNFPTPNTASQLVASVKTDHIRHDNADVAVEASVDYTHAFDDPLSEDLKQFRNSTLNCSDLEQRQNSASSSKQTKRVNPANRRPVSESETLPAKKRRLAPSTSKEISARQPNVQRENYVRINLKKKVFCRGKKKFNYRRYKFKKWKQMKKWKKTPFQKCSSPDGDEEGNNDEDLSAIPDEILLDAKVGASQNRRTPKKSTDNEQESSQTMLSSVNPANHSMPTLSVSGPLCELVDGKLSKDVEDDVMAALKLFGYSQFQFGQFETIKRVLTGLSTLLIQPTGSGKSLCYLLPAYLYARRLSAVTLVVSPLVSLMDDQLAGVPKCLRAACHHTGMTVKQREKVRDALGAGKVDVLFLSPEALVSGVGSAFGVLPFNTPPIAFVCIDEVHCVSAWSHNFRPCYLRLCRVIQEGLGVRCILGLTATASNATAENIVEHLGVSGDDLQSVIKFNVLPDNLELTVSRDNREEAFIQLLKSEPFMRAPSIIVYCIRREQTERLASIIRTCLQTEANEWSAEAYHAGLSSCMRHSVQKRFMSDKLRVVVATVAFGMGLNKSNVRAVIHFNMPKCIESYVQEIGRSGRDGRLAHCHLFLDLHGRDQQELGRHIYANTVDRAAIKKLLMKVFKPCRCNSLREIEGTVTKAGFQDSADGNETPSESWKCSGHEVAFVVDETVEELDMKEEGIDTLLCYLESHPEHPIKLLNRTYANCVIFSYGGARQLTNLAEKNSILAVAMAMSKNKQKLDSETKKPSNQIEFNLTELARMLGQKSSDLRRDLKKLQWNTMEVQGVVKYRKTDFVVDFVGVSFHVIAVGDLSPEKVDQLTDYLHKRVLLRECTDIEQLEMFHATLHSVSSANYSQDDQLNQPRSQKLKTDIRKHFEKSSVPSLDEVVSLTDNVSSKDVTNEEDIRGNIRRFLGIHHDVRFSGRAVARIFHGIGSPRYPAEVWGKARQFWRCHLEVDFNALCRLAKEEILR